MIASILQEISARYGLRRGSGRYSGPCPECGGNTGSDRFVIKDDGGFKCYACNFKGDIVTWLRRMEGKTCPDAHEAAGLACRSASCPVRGTCRLGDGSGRRPARIPRSVHPPRENEAPALPVLQPRTPQQIWLDWATGLAGKAAANLASHPDIIAWLGRRGIQPWTADRYRLGWLAHDLRIKRSALGLPPRDGKDKIWIPGGLLIPAFDEAGFLNRLRIRRTESARKRFLPELKYVWIEGSGTAPMALGPAENSRGTVIVEAELDALAVAAAHQQVNVVALGTVSAGLPEGLSRRLRQSPVILVALDADPGRDGKPGAGPAAISAWIRQYRQARFWPVPAGKDPGEYAEQGGDLRLWVESGLIPEVKTPPSHDLSLSPGNPQPGRRGENSPPSEDPPVSASPRHYILALPDGRDIHITDNKDIWSLLADEGNVVFSENELKKFQAACSRMDRPQRLLAAMQIVDIKQIFKKSRILRGEAAA